MITIQGFAGICGCNTQTLRYYDRIGLLTPAKVDPWTGYRYYEEEQALRFVKIKNLQQADFSIEEIRPLLEADDERLAEAFERKIEQQQKKLEKIREIQRSYLKEKMEMQNMVLTLTEFVKEKTDDPVLWAELGLDGAEQTEIAAQVHAMVADWLTQCRNAGEEIARSMDPGELDTMKQVMDKLTGSGPDEGEKLIVSVAPEADGQGCEVPSDAEKVFERSGWAHVSEWIKELPDLSDDSGSWFLFRVREDSPAADPGLPTLMLAVAAVRCGAMNGGMNCNVLRSADGLNHFELLKK